MIKNFILVFLLLLLSFSCQKGPVKKKEQVVRITIHSDPPTLDPRNGGDYVSNFIFRHCYEGLMRKDLQGEIQPALAERYEVSDDGLHYLFFLRESYWSDGRPLTAHDFERSWKSVVSPSSNSRMSECLFVLKNGKRAYHGECSIDEVGVKALDAKQLQVDLEYSSPHFPDFLAFNLFFPVSDPFDPFLSNGPFLLKENRPFDQIELIKNPHYWDREKVKLDGITIPIVGDMQTMLDLFQKNELDWIGYPLSNLPTDALEKLKKDIRFHATPSYCIYFYQFNTEKFPFNNLKMRKALSLAINREEIIQHITQLGEIPAFSYTPDAFWPEEPPPLFKEDRTEAKELFNQALQELGITASELPPFQLIYNTSELNVRIAQAITRQWASLFGIETKVQNIEFKVFVDTIQHSEYQITKLIRYTTINDPRIFLEVYGDDHPAGFRGNWRDPNYLDLLKKAKQTSDSQEYHQLLRQAEKILISDMPLIPLFFQSGAYMKNPRLKDVHISPYMEVDFKQAYLEP